MFCLMFLVCEMLSWNVNGLNFCKITLILFMLQIWNFWFKVCDFDLELVCDLTHILFYIQEFIELYMFMWYIESRPIQTWSFVILFNKFINSLKFKQLVFFGQLCNVAKVAMICMKI
jgi:hypothetical protein